MEWTAEWYRYHHDGEDMETISMQQLIAYQSRVLM